MGLWRLSLDVGFDTNRSARELYWTIIRCSIFVPDPAEDSGCWCGWIRNLLAELLCLIVLVFS